MNLIYETFFGITKRRLAENVPLEKEKVFDNTPDQESYTSDELDKDDLQDLFDAEHERVKQWRDPNFKQTLKTNAKEKSNRDVNVTNKKASKVYRKMYDQEIRPNSAFNLIDKIQKHPDLTIIDNDYINSLRRKTMRNAGICQVSVFMAMFWTYKVYPSARTPRFQAVMVVTPAVALLSTFYIDNRLSIAKVKRIGLDAKYGLA